MKFCIKSLLKFKVSYVLRAGQLRFACGATITTKKSGVYEFGADDIVKGSGYISSRSCGNTEIELGMVYSSESGI